MPPSELATWPAAVEASGASMCPDGVGVKTSRRGGSVSVAVLVLALKLAIAGSAFRSELEMEESLGPRFQQTFRRSSRRVPAEPTR